MAPSVGESLRLYLSGIARRGYYLLFALLLDPFEVFNHFISPLLPTKEPLTVDISIAWFWCAFVAIFGWVSFLTYRQLHTEKMALEYRVLHSPRATFRLVKAKLEECIQRAQRWRDEPRATPAEAFAEREEIVRFLEAALPSAFWKPMQQHCDQLVQLERGSSNDVSSFSKFIEKHLSKILSEFSSAGDLLTTFDLERWREWSPILRG